MYAYNRVYIYNLGKLEHFTNLRPFGGDFLYTMIPALGRTGFGRYNVPIYIY